MAISTLTQAAKAFVAPNVNVFTRNSEVDIQPSDSFSFRGCTGGTQPSPSPSPSPAPNPSPEPGPNPNPDPTPGMKKWTVMLYSCSDNNLYRFMQDDLNECEQVGTTDQMNVVAYTDHHPKGGNAGYYEVQTNNTPGFTSPVKEDRGQRDLGTPKELSDFIQWGMKNYPAENFMLIVSDHGAAWQGACSDDGGGGWLTLPKIEEGLKSAREATGRKLDVLGFDACLMANMEVAHQLKDEAKFMVASEETEGGAGWQYNRVLSKDTLAQADEAMRSRLDYSPKEMAEGVVRMAKGVQGDLATMAAYDMSKVPALSTSVDNLGKALLASKTANKDLTAAATASQGFYMEKDLYDFAERVARTGDPAVAEAAKGVKSALEDTLVAEQHSSRYPGAHGMTIELNPQSANVAQRNNPTEDLNRVSFDSYANTKFAQENSFDDAVRKFRN